MAFLTLLLKLCLPVPVYVFGRNAKGRKERVGQCFVEGFTAGVCFALFHTHRPSLACVSV